MKEKYYYYRDKGNRPIVTICLVFGNGDIGKGVAICSTKDNPNKKTGRAIARGRAIQAMGNRKSNWDILRKEALEALGKAKLTAGYLDFSKAAFNPFLTPLETKLLGA